MSTEVAVVATEKQQQGWIALSNIKAQLFDKLSKGELVIQGYLNDIEHNERLDDVQMRIKQAKSQMNADVADRKAFTGMITEKIIEPAMAYEKRNAEQIKKAEAVEFVLRKKEATAIAERNAVESEKANFRTHCINEGMRIAAEYRIKLGLLISQAYTQGLNTGVLVPIETLANILKEEKKDAFRKYPLAKITPDEAAAIFASCPQYNHTEDLNKAIAEATEKWQHFQQDFANAAAAIKSEETLVLEKVQETKEDLQIETATNVLVAQAELSALVEGPKIKRKVEVVVSNSEGWAMGVIAAFLKNWKECSTYIRVKSWDKLSLGQMAAALGQLATATGVMEQGLEYQEIEK